VRATYALVAGGVVEAKGRDREEARPPVAPSRVGTTTDPPLPPLEPEGTPEAAPAVEEASSATPSDPETGEQRARALLEQGDSERAVALLTELVKQHPESVACRRLLAMARANDLGADPAVEELFLNVLVAAPKDAELRYRLARYYLRAGSKARAMLQLRLVLSSDPGHAGAWRDLGELEAGEGQRGR
jgi:predicted Zn-dependent protease